jgi:hypothetical protein
VPPRLLSTETKLVQPMTHEMKVYQFDVQIAGTLYVKANSEKDALFLAQTASNLATLNVADAGGSEIPISSEHLPEISLSPEMTVHGIWEERYPPGTFSTG